MTSTARPTDVQFEAEAGLSPLAWLGIGTGVAAVVGLLGWWATRERECGPDSALSRPRFSAFASAPRNEYTINIAGSAFEPRAQGFIDELEDLGFEITDLGTASSFSGDVLGGDIEAIGQPDAGRGIFVIGQKHGVQVQYVSSGPTGEEKRDLLDERKALYPELFS